MELFMLDWVVGFISGLGIEDSREVKEDTDGGLGKWDWGQKEWDWGQRICNWGQKEWDWCQKKRGWREGWLRDWTILKKGWKILE